MQPTRLFDFIDYQRQHRPLDKAINTKYKGQWEATSSEELSKSTTHKSGTTRYGHQTWRQNWDDFFQ